MCTEDKNSEGQDQEAQALDDFEWGRNPVTTAAFRIAELITGRKDSGHDDNEQDR